MRTWLLITPILILFTACEFPKDPENTLKKVKDGQLRVGISENPPWTQKSGETWTGIEPALIERYAKKLNAEIKWIAKSESELMKELENHRLDLVISGLREDNPHSKSVGFTYGYAGEKKAKRVMAVPPGENAFLSDLERFLRAEDPKAGEQKNASR